MPRIPNQAIRRRWDGYAYEIDPDFSALAAEVAARRNERAAPGQSG